MVGGAMFGGTKKDEDRYKGGGFKKVKVEEVEEKKWAPPPAIVKREKTWDEMTAEEKFNSQLPSFLPGHGKTASELPTECVKDDDHHWRQRKADAVRHAITKTNNFLEVNGNAQDGSSGGGGGCRPIVKRAIKASSPRATSCTTSAD